MQNEIDQNEVPLDELTVLKERARKTGITFHPSIGLDALRKKVNDHLAGESPKPEKEKEGTEETLVQMKMRLRKEASELVRVQVTCMNPNKREWEGEIFTVSNSYVGTFKKYVPFNAEDGWHVPRIILNVIKNRKCQTFTTKKDHRGNTVRVGKLVPEFNVVELPALTETELQELAQRQAMRNGGGL